MKQNQAMHAKDGMGFLQWKIKRPSSVMANVRQSKGALDYTEDQSFRDSGFCSGVCNHTPSLWIWAFHVINCSAVDVRILASRESTAHSRRYDLSSCVCHGPDLRFSRWAALRDTLLGIRLSTTATMGTTPPFADLRSTYAFAQRFEAYANHETICRILGKRR